MSWKLLVVVSFALCAIAIQARSTVNEADKELLLRLLADLVETDAVEDKAEAPDKRDLHGKHVYMMPLSVEEAKSVLTGQAVPLRNTRYFADDAEHLDVMPVSIYTSQEGRVHGLLLARNYRIEHPYEVTLNEELEGPMPELRHAAFYQGSNAVFGVQHIDGRKEFDGSFSVDGREYEVHPVEDEVQARSLHGHKAHLVTRSTHKNIYAEPLEHPEMRQGVEYGNDELPAPVDEKRVDGGGVEYGNDELDPEDRNEKINKRSTRYNVDMALIVDYSEYAGWLERTGSSYGAIAAIKYKFQYMYNGMDYIYKTINHNGMTITPYVRKLHIQNSMDDNPIDKLYGGGLEGTEDRMVTVDAYKILGYLRTNLPNWGSGYAIGDTYDHVMYWIGYQMKSDDGSSAVIGLAYSKATCGRSSYSLIEDTGFESFRTAAHELGHSLGSSHDKGYGDCSPSKYHVMGSKEGLPERYNSVDGFTFSTCSLNAFADYLGTQSCLNNGAYINDISRYQVYPLPGKKFTADQQCQWHNPQFNGGGACDMNSFASLEEADVCNKGLYCKVDNTSSCSGGIRPADGTPCGSYKTCLKGTCQ